MLHLQILPGGGNLLHPPYRDVYQLLEELAQRNGYDSSATCAWPAHSAYGSEPEVPLTFPDARDVAHSAIEDLERRGEPYDLLTRSFGCTVAAVVLNDLKPRGLRRLILWGPVSFADYWRLFVRDLSVQKRKAAARSVVIDERFFPSHVPLETFVPTIRVPTDLVRGTLDELCPEAFLTYLTTLFDPSCVVRVRSADGARHEVVRSDPPAVLAAYEASLFANDLRHGGVT